MGPKRISKALASVEHTLAEMEKLVIGGEQVWKEVVDNMKQQWIIDGEWSQYHAMVANGQGWGLSYRDGMWRIISLDMTKFDTDEAARLYVLRNEKDQNSSLYAFAVRAVIVGNMR